MDVCGTGCRSLTSQGGAVGIEYFDVAHLIVFVLNRKDIFLIFEFDGHHPITSPSSIQW